MKTKILLAAAITLLLASPAFSQIVPQPCPTASLATYIGFGSIGCVWDNVLYRNFSYPVPTSNEIPASAITVTPVPLPIAYGAAISELKFSANWSAAAGGTEQSVIGYSVIPYALEANPVATPGTLTLDLGPSQVSGIIGSVTVTEKVTPSPASTGTTLEVYDICADACEIKQTDSVTITSISSLQTLITVALSGGTDGASLSSFSVLDAF